MTYGADVERDLLASAGRANASPFMVKFAANIGELCRSVQLRCDKYGREVTEIESESTWAAYFMFKGICHGLYLFVEDLKEIIENSISYDIYGEKLHDDIYDFIFSYCFKDMLSVEYGECCLGRLIYIKKQIIENLNSDIYKTINC